MSITQTCIKCGAALTSEAPQGLCPRCLMEAVLAESAGNQTLRGLPNPTAVRRTIRYFGDYELNEEIARGGMGVVYKARQVTLNRTVAVKMILAGNLASPSDVQRFLTEAEAAANLQHPNIVAIHEIGQHEGQYYFSMDFVEGKNLADHIKESPITPRKAAELLKEIAEAIHYAHQRGTLHRDLKPHNVLMDAQGRPRITDFGLAKRIEKESGLTLSGSILGSPAYMPPEQAAGRNSEVGPASDVYALGAILYHMLTGRPPFTGANAIEIIRGVTERDPVPPSKVNPKTPADLETICLKCLEKNPQRRYFSAQDLAQELDRFLNHEPIFAKPSGAIYKAWSWCQRHPWALTGAAAMLMVLLLGVSYGLWESLIYTQWQAGKRPRPSPGFHWTNLQAALGLCLVVLLELAVAFSWLFMRDRRRRNLPFSTGYLICHAALGAGLIVFAAAIGRGSIRELVWYQEAAGVHIIPNFVGGLFAAALMAWAGLHFVIQALLQHRVLISGTEQKPPVLFAETFKVDWRRFAAALLIVHPLMWLAQWQLIPSENPFFFNYSTQWHRIHAAILASLCSNIVWLLLAARRSRGQARVFFGVALAILFMVVITDTSFLVYPPHFYAAVIPGLIGGALIAAAAGFRPILNPAQVLNSLSDAILWDRPRFLAAFGKWLLLFFAAGKLLAIAPGTIFRDVNTSIFLGFTNMLLVALCWPLRAWRTQAPLAATMIFVAVVCGSIVAPLFANIVEGNLSNLDAVASCVLGLLAGYAAVRMGRLRFRPEFRAAAGWTQPIGPEATTGQRAG